MIKQTFVILFIFLLCSSCGKKGDPFYNKDNLNSKTHGADQITFS
jgi:hypothetical protein